MGQKEDFDPSKENLFDYTKRMQDLNEIEDEETLDNTKIETILDDGKLDLNQKEMLNFTPGSIIADKVNLTKEEIDRFSEIYEEIYKVGKSFTTYNKSIQDQLKQSGMNVSIEQSSMQWEYALDKLLDLKMLKFLCDLVFGQDKEIRDKIINNEIDKKFPSQTQQQINTNQNYDDLIEQLTRISRKAQKRNYEKK